eukprot:m.242839 g.242839  ORF g.242839 m.242839 type:complete len:107 (-) comp26338_c0_seq1:168-488(-)
MCAPSLLLLSTQQSACMILLPIYLALPPQARSGEERILLQRAVHRQKQREFLAAKYTASATLPRCGLLRYFTLCLEIFIYRDFFSDAFESLILLWSFVWSLINLKN